MEHIDGRVMTIPPELYAEFTMNGLCGVEYRYLDNSSEEIQRQINGNFTKEIFEKYLQMVRNGESNYYGNTDKWLYQALSKYPIEKKDICIFGSANPWYEAVSLAYGVENCRVVEYSERKSFHERIRYLKPGEDSADHDAAFSISSFEHDGLGRYGDPINPRADINAMQNARRSLRKGGLLYFAVPVGRDKLCFNVHRIYGKHRLPLMFEGWEWIDSFGFRKRDYRNNLNNADGTPYQPVFVLRKAD